MRDGGEPSVRVPPEGGRLGRLTKRAEFLAAASGRRFHTERVSVQGLRRADEAEPQGLRVGFTVTKRVGHATERNRIRRRLRAAVQEAGAPFRDLSLDIVLVGRRDALSASFPDLIADLARAVPAVARPGQPGGGSGQKGRRRGRGHQPGQGRSPESGRDANPPHGTDPASSPR